MFSGSSMFSRQAEYQSSASSSSTSQATAQGPKVPATGPAVASPQPPQRAAENITGSGTSSRPVSTAHSSATAHPSAAEKRHADTNLNPSGTRVQGTAAATHAHVPTTASHAPAATHTHVATGATHAHTSHSAAVHNAGPTHIVVSVTKGEHGIGLDLGKSATGMAAVQRLKEMPPGIVNPASLCKPAILPNDIIVEVNGSPAPTFMEAVKLIRASEGTIRLKLERHV